jgi:hypothetical protein
MRTVAVIEPGSAVLAGPEGADVPGLVLAAKVGRGGAVEYLVAWWDDRDRSEVWLDEAEVRPDGAGRAMRLGFGPGGG